ncbi:MAG: squalene/phytoene synthase family protein [Alphaproteobacteria bacterium]|nr:squalene/phytoene synthase family protein [Alphaproteobacteria bacterium]
MISLGDVVKKSRSSLFWCMQGYPKAKREALYTLYAFCCHIDDIVNSSMPSKEKQNLLEAWREELNNIYDKKVPATNIGRKIYKNCMRFNLSKSKFSAILDSAFFNVPNPLQAPKQEIFEKYVYGVAVAPIELALTVMCSEKEKIRDELARNLGTAIITTFILKDIKSDAKKNRLYIPLELLKKSKVKIGTPLSVIENKNIINSRENLSEIAEKSYKRAWRLLDKMNKKETFPLRFIGSVSECYFNIMKNRGWEIIAPKPYISSIKKIKIAFKTIFD